MLIFVTAVTVALVVSFLCSIFESVLLSIRPTQVEALVSKGWRSGYILKGFKQKIDMPIAAILIVNTIAHTIGATVAGASYVDVFGHDKASELGAWFDGFSNSLILDQRALWVFLLVYLVIRGAGAISLDYLLAGRRSSYP